MPRALNRAGFAINRKPHSILNRSHHVAYHPMPLASFEVTQRFTSYRAALNAALDSMGSDSAFQADDVEDDDARKHIPPALLDEWIFSIRIETGGWDICYVHAFEPEHHYSNTVHATYYTITPKLESE
jgi:hypothetical protein